MVRDSPQDLVDLEMPERLACNFIVIKASNKCEGLVLVSTVKTRGAGFLFVHGSTRYLCSCIPNLKFVDAAAGISRAEVQVDREPRGGLPLAGPAPRGRHRLLSPVARVV